MSAQVTGRGPRAQGAAEQTKDAPLAADAEPSSLLHWATNATRGGETSLECFPAFLNNGVPALYLGAGEDWAGTPVMGEGGGSEDIEVSIASFA